MPNRHSRAGWALAILALAGCDGETAGAAWTSSDSTGVTVLRGPPPTAVLGTQAPEAAVVVEGVEDTPLFRLGDIAVRGDRGFYAVDGGNQRILSFDANGDLVGLTGSQGDGPGEFQNPATLAEYADSVFVYDRRHRRVTVFTQQLAYVRDQTLVAPEGFAPPQFEGILGNGAWVGRVPTPLSGLPSSGVLRVPVRFMTLPPASGDIVAEGRGSERWVSILTEGGQTVSANIVGYDFFRGTYIGFGATSFALGDSDDWTLAVHAADGTLSHRIEVDRLDEPFGSAGVDRFVAARTDQTAQELRDLRESLEAMDLPENMPTYSDIVIDDLSRVWARATNLDRNRSYEWTVFDDTGAIGTVTTLPRFTLKAVAQGRLYGVFRDEFDVESLRVYDLEPAP